MDRVRIAAGSPRRGARLSTGAAFGNLGVLMFAVTACVPLQRVDFEIEPIPQFVYVDGGAITPVPTGLDLRSDRDHTLYFKRDGYRPELVVLHSVPGVKKPRLEPSRVSVRLRPLNPGGREVRIERDEPTAP